MSSNRPSKENAPLIGDCRPLLSLRGITKQYGSNVVIEELDLDIWQGDFLAILGPSGCGKTTLLRIIGGFVAPTTGSVFINGSDVTRLGPERRPTNTVFQGYGLFPHMTVRQNVGYGLRLKRFPRKEIDSNVNEALERTRLTPLADRPVTALSGGQQQRVALARALILRPNVLLLDESLAALDLKLRQTMQEELRRLHREFGGTFVFVTHDQSEALSMANRVAVMNSGRFEQVGEASNVYNQPKTRFVATFIGDANLLTGLRRNDRITLHAGPSFDATGPDGPTTTVVRPSSIRFLADHEHAEIALAGVLEDVLFLGEHVKYTIATQQGDFLTIRCPTAAAPKVSVGQPIRFGWQRQHCHVLDEKARG